MTSQPSTDVTGAIAVLGRLADLFAERREQIAQRAGITVGEWRVLERIAGGGFLPSMFARERESTRAAVSRTLRGLLVRGAIAVEVSKADGRQRSYSLTPLGRRLLKSVERQRERAVEAVWGGIEARRLREFTDFGCEIAGRMEKHARLEGESRNG